MPHMDHNIDIEENRHFSSENSDCNINPRYICDLDLSQQKIKNFDPEKKCDPRKNLTQEKI
jgi:hypothetical protein